MSEGRRIRSLKPFNKIFPYLMPRRTDAVVYVKEILPAEPLERFLEEQNAKGKHLNHLHLFLAAYSRVLAQRPALNRYVRNSAIYAREDISISMAVKKRVVDSADETSVKFYFTGLESLEEVEKHVNETVLEAVRDDSADVEKVANRLMRMPWILKWIVTKILLGMDAIGWLPKSIIKASPFHASLFVSHLKSIRAPYAYHHLYNLGSVSIFITIGKIVELPMVEQGEVVIKRCFEIGYTIDERICDGLYVANSFKMVKEYLSEPERLLTPLKERIYDID